MTEGRNPFIFRLDLGLPPWERDLFAGARKTLPGIFAQGRKAVARTARRELHAIFFAFP